jgi:tRNA threonylcarbamoyladenosine biosynthesis protein TsaE
MKEKVLIKNSAKDESDTKEFAVKSLKYFKSGDTILLYGDLGSGKTFLTKLYSQMLGVDFDVTSPSFSIINQYQGDLFINHLDFYRVEKSNELHNLGLDDILNMDSINFIEWPQIIENQLFWDHYRIYIDFDEKNPTGRFFKLISMRI